MPSRTRRHVTRLTAIAASAAGAFVLLAGPAAAHVRVIADVIPGQPATLQFRVPSELADATTVRIAVVVPPEVEVTEVPLKEGWTAETIPGPADQGARLVWTAEPGHEIQPAESATFPVLVGPVPDQRSLTFNTEQTYSNGTVAAWNQPQTGGEEPPFPAPVLIINPEAAPPTGNAGHPPATGTAHPGAGSTAPSIANVAGDSTGAGQTGLSAGLLGGIGLGVVLVGVVTAILLRRRRSRMAARS
ncbi:Conserved membrane protein in copper uptake, YcnI [Alloactinosynnema sp. L-07]|uniref:DUF1775 domain-containing protein n=1 Tax=Alloactinosynnema sp. L-07 TaxID=1653480 RepID=UPI00065F0089|nr:DUF1775 domain-containing protein [Alloactinosynnema sp. L-07]CRK55569.1 Conserved membrane protein in copper uptake, YcnI [Alloactinosynnema sp. L-07]